MKLYIRFLKMFFRYLFDRTEVDLSEPFERTFTVRFTDLDFLRHMTNSRYPALVDLVRSELFLRSVNTVAPREGWRPLLTSSYYRFRKELRRGDEFTIRYEMVHASGDWFYIRYSFIKDGVVHCQVLERFGFHRKGGGMIPAITAARVLGYELSFDEPPPYVAKWIETEEELRKVARRGS